MLFQTVLPFSPPPTGPTTSPGILPAPIRQLLHDLFAPATSTAPHPGVVPPPASVPPAPHLPASFTPAAISIGSGIMCAALSMFGNGGGLMAFAVGALAAYGAYKLYQHFRSSHP